VIRAAFFSQAGAGASNAAGAAGLAHAAPDTRLLTGFCGNQHDPALAEARAEEQCVAGAVLRFATVDGGHPGEMAALRRAIGNVRNWTTRDPAFLASAVADSGWWIVAAPEAFPRDEWQDARIGLERPGTLRLAFAPDIPPSFAAQLRELAEAVVAGRIFTPEHYDSA
jgi:basic membrane protein A